jgi:hypothetical protein
MEKPMNSSKPTIVMVGCHGSGKTTLGTILANRLRVEHHEEIGKALRREAMRIEPGCTAEKSQSEFDAEVFRREVERDFRPFGGRVVETWHPGNLAFASLRSPDTARLHSGALRFHVLRLRGPIWVQPLEIGEETVMARITEAGDDPGRMARFFMSVYRLTMKIVKSWGLCVLPPVQTDRLDVRDSLSAVLRNLAEHGAVLPGRGAAGAHAEPPGASWQAAQASPP